MHNDFVEGSPRTISTHAAAVAGYVAVRLNVLLSVEAGTQAGAISRISVKNTGVNTLGLQFKETNDISNEGVRSNLGSALTIVPEGFEVINVTPTKGYVELACVTGSGSVKVEVASSLIWDIQGFSKTDTAYPEVLWRAQ